MYKVIKKKKEFTIYIVIRIFIFFYGQVFRSATLLEDLEERIFRANEKLTKAKANVGVMEEVQIFTINQPLSEIIILLLGVWLKEEKERNLRKRIKFCQKTHTIDF